MFIKDDTLYVVKEVDIEIRLEDVLSYVTFFIKGERLLPVDSVSIQAFSAPMSSSPTSFVLAFTSLASISAFVPNWPLVGRVLFPTYTNNADDDEAPT